MQEDRPMLVSSETTKRTPLLVIDKKGSMGNDLAKELQEQFLVVLVSSFEQTPHNNVIHIPFKKKIPVIPDNYYSQIFLFYNGEQEALDMLPSVNKKAQETNARFVFVTSLPYLSPTLLRHLSHPTYREMHVVIYGELFDRANENPNVVSMFLRQARSQQRIVLPNDGLDRLYPIARKDVLDGIISVAFSLNAPTRLLVYPKHAVSGLSIARMIKKHYPWIKVDFGRYKGIHPVYHLPSEGEYYADIYPLEKRLQDVLSDITEKRDTVVVKKRTTHQFPKRTSVFSSQTWWLLFVAIVVVPVVFVLLSALVGVAALAYSVRELEQGNLPLARQSAGVAKGAFAVSEQTGQTLFYLDVVAPSQKKFLLEYIAVGKELSATGEEALQGMQLLVSVMEKKSVQPKDDFLEGMAILKKSMITVQKIRAEGKLPKQIVAKVDALAPVWIPLQNVIDSLPVVLGFDHKKVYLVLLQNNMELRPGGGFIGSYGLLRVKNGAIEDFSVHDVYDADGKLTFHIEPPYGLRRYLGASHWFLRDSNFAIDFPQNASQAMTFLELETGEKVDGVIALDTTFFKNLLEAFTSVNVPEYKETITPENFYLRTQTHVEKDFFPGSTQKKDFLQALLNAMEERLASRQDVSYDVLVDKLGESIRGKHVLFSFRDEAVQKLFVVTGISSTLWDSRSSRENTFLDTFGVIDANVGVNKANYYLTREIEQKVSISASGTIQTTARVLYTNTSKRDSQFGGDYKNFVRFILPAQAVIRSIRIDGVDQEIVPAVTDPAIFTDNDFVPPEGLEVAIVNEQDKTTVGFLVLVPRGKSKTVNVTYEVVRAISPQEPVFDYALWVYKQPGTVGDSYSFSVSYPESYQIIRKDDALSDVGGKLVYSDLLSEDTYFTVGFSKK